MTSTIQRPYRVVWEPGHGLDDRHCTCVCDADELTDIHGAALFSEKHAHCVTPEVADYRRAMRKACPHGPDEPCTCPGCHGGEMGCTGYTVGCTCDIDWQAMYELAQERS